MIKRKRHNHHSDAASDLPNTNHVTVLKSPDPSKFTAVSSFGSPFGSSVVETGHDNPSYIVTETNSTRPLSYLADEPTNANRNLELTPHDFDSRQRSYSGTSEAIQSASAVDVFIVRNKETPQPHQTSFYLRIAAISRWQLNLFWT